MVEVKQEGKILLIKSLVNICGKCGKLQKIFTRIMISAINSLWKTCGKVYF